MSTFLYAEGFRVLSQHLIRSALDCALSDEFIYVIHVTGRLNKQSCHSVKRYLGNSLSNLKNLRKWFDLECALGEQYNRYRYLLEYTSNPYKISPNGNYIMENRFGRWRNRIKLDLPHTGTLTEPDLYRIKLEKKAKGADKYGYTVHLQVNKNAVANYLAQGETDKIPLKIRSSIFRTFAALVTKNLFLAKFVKEIDKAVDYDHLHIDFPISPVIQNVSLFGYQKRNVEWLLNIERNTKQVLQYQPSLQFGSVWVDPIARKFSHNKKINEIKFIGGCLLDEVGLGKTLVSITLTMMNQAPTEIGTADKFVNVQFAGKCPAKIKSGKEKGKPCGSIIKNTKTNIYTYCGRHRKMQKEEILIPKFPEISAIQNPKMYHHSKKNLLLKSRATLVVCPNQLPHQWRLQIEKYTNPVAKYVLCTTKYDYDNLRYRDIVNADFVITTFDFLAANKHFKKMYCVADNKNILGCTNPYFEDFYWHRIIVDEVHKLLEKKFKGTLDYVTRFESKYKHGLSSSAFSKGNESYKVILGLLTDNKDPNAYIYLKKSEIKKYFRKNTKESTAKEQMEIPPVTETVIWMKFSQTEKAMYTARISSYNSASKKNLDFRMKGDEYLRQLCCYPQLSAETRNMMEGANNQGAKSLADIRQVMITNVQKEITAKKQEIKQLVLEVFANKPYLETDMKKVLPQYEGDDHPDYLKQFRMARRRLKSHYRKLAFLLTSLKAYENVDKESAKAQPKPHITKCQTCHTNIQLDSIAITSCGHQVCSQCCKSQKIRKCRFCDVRLTKANVLALGEINIFHSGMGDAEIVPKAFYVKNENKLDYCTTLYGTKMANILLFIQNYLFKNPNNRAIIFSQWDNMLQIVKKILQQNGIGALVCKGSVHQKNKAIVNFKQNDKYKIILLSTKYTASGLDLIEANFIMFIDPVYGIQDYKESIEHQAIGRAHRLGQTKKIEVVRFLMKGTVEEKIHQENAKEMKKIMPADAMITNEIDTWQSSEDSDELTPTKIKVV